MQSPRDEKDALVVWGRALQVVAIGTALRVARLANAGVVQLAFAAAASAVSAVKQLPTFPATRKKTRAWASRVMKKSLLTTSGYSSSNPDLSKLVGSDGTPIFNAKGYKKLNDLVYPGDYVLLHDWFKANCDPTLLVLG